jgi:hypothetical protein
MIAFTCYGWMIVELFYCLHQQRRKEGGQFCVLLYIRTYKFPAVWGPPSLPGGHHDESPFYPLGGGVDGLTRGDPVSLSWARRCPWFFVALLHGVAKSDFITVALLLFHPSVSLSCITKTIDTSVHGMGTRTNLVHCDRITEYSGMSKCNVCFTICRCRGWK